MAGMLNFLRPGTKRDKIIRTKTLTKKDQIPFKKKYKLGNKLLGTGDIATIKLGVTQKGHEKVAVKIVDKTKLKLKDLEKIERESEVLQTLDHPNVVKIYDFYDVEEEKVFYIVMEYIDGGELFDKISKDDIAFTENESRNIIKTIAQALQYCKNKGVVHKDIKPENILLTGEGEIKLADFNLTKIIDQDKTDFTVLETMAGVPNYFAPEVLNGKSYTYKSDIWSLGVITFLLLSGGYLPFNLVASKCEGKDEFVAKIKAGKWKFVPTKVWENVSDQAQDFISKLLVRDPKERFNYEQLLGHPWFQNNSDQLKNNYISKGRMMKFNKKRRILSSAVVDEAARALGDLMGPAAKNDEFNQTMMSIQSMPEVKAMDPSGELFNYDSDFS